MSAMTKEDMMSVSEKGSGKGTSQASIDVQEAGFEAQGIHVPTTGFLAKLWRAVLFVDKFGVEVRGIERVRPEDRSPRSTADLLDSATMWLAANSTISTFSLGTLGPSTFGLGLKESCLAILFFNLLATLPVAYFAVWGPRLGLRQMTISRFSFGYYCAWFPVVLNVIACIGWSTINSIVGGQALRAVSSTHQIPEAAAIVVIALLTATFALFGYRYVHLYERYSFLPVVVIFIISLGLSAKYMDSGAFAASGPVEAANILSFGAALVGFGIGWSSLAADYTVNLPEDVSGKAVFWLTYAGLNLPCILIECLGAAEATITRPDWQARYASGGIGGLLAATLSPAKGFGQFLQVLLALSIVGNNIPNMYSFALTFQVLGRRAQLVPRVFLVLLGTVVYIVLAIVGATHFEAWLDTLLVLLSYWLAIFSAILVEEHFLFRGGRWENYNPDDYNKPQHLPLGAAAAFATGCGIMGAVLGMATQWYVGVLGAKIGDPAFGGDIGFELSCAFSAIVYPIARYIERRFESPARMRTAAEGAAEYAAAEKH
ncbi:permease for cytosine/purines, uracil, thiamine, allantoin-domain-containing protein [Phellopilus nigrolimitatus]|nr:permease for cytosine/purines, uracil, thiamine, allantoin-domain-containing protein [Phellopilus nigrolimitatus]